MAGPDYGPDWLQKQISKIVIDRAIDEILFPPDQHGEKEVRKNGRLLIEILDWVYNGGAPTNELTVFMCTFELSPDRAEDIKDWITSLGPSLIRMAIREVAEWIDYDGVLNAVTNIYGACLMDIEYNRFSTEAATRKILAGCLLDPEKCKLTLDPRLKVARRVVASLL